jgi:hypothetical protein
MWHESSSSSKQLGLFFLEETNFRPFFGNSVLCVTLQYSMSLPVKNGRCIVMILAASSIKKLQGITTLALSVLHMKYLRNSANFIWIYLVFHKIFERNISCHLWTVNSVYGLSVEICWYLTHSLTHSWSWALLEKLPIVQLPKNFPAFYETRRFITVFTRTLHWSLSWARSVQSIPSHPISLRSILILSTHLHLGLASGLLSGFPTNILYAFLLSQFVLHALSISSSLTW